MKIANEQFAVGAIDYTPVFVAQQFLVGQQNLYAQSQGDIALGMIGVYRAMGGGWEIRLADSSCVPAPSIGMREPTNLPTPVPAAPRVAIGFFIDGENTRFIDPPRPANK